MWHFVNRKAGLSIFGLLGIVLVLAGMPASPGTAQAEPKATSVTIEPIKHTSGQPAVLVATLTGADGKPIGGQPLRFYVETDAFGPRLMKVGEGVTDIGGSASVEFRPTWVGENKIAVVFAGTETLARSKGESSFTAVGPVQVHQNAEFGLETVRDAAPLVAFALVIGVWGTLITVVARTFLVIRGGRRGEVASGTQAPLSGGSSLSLPTDER